jgi:hypothetical protein
MSLKRE